MTEPTTPPAEPPPKPGRSTSEFKVTVLIAAVGVYLIVVKNDIENGVLLLASAALGYPVSRGLSKVGHDHPPPNQETKP